MQPSSFLITSNRFLPLSLTSDLPYSRLVPASDVYFGFLGAYFSHLPCSSLLYIVLCFDLFVVLERLDPQRVFPLVEVILKGPRYISDMFQGHHVWKIICSLVCLQGFLDLSSAITSCHIVQEELAQLAQLARFSVCLRVGSWSPPQLLVVWLISLSALSCAFVKMNSTLLLSTILHFLRDATVGSPLTTLYTCLSLMLLKSIQVLFDTALAD